LSNDIHNIRVADIAKTAGVHRATFYRHVEDIQDLLERGTAIFWNNLIQTMEAKRVGGNVSLDKSKAPDYLSLLFKQILKEKDVFKAFLLQKSSNYFYTFIQRETINFVQKYRMIDTYDDNSRYHIASMIGASLFITIELIVDKETCIPYLDTYYAFVRHAKKIKEWNYPSEYKVRNIC
jgi:AcrR family transcriptional regulator